LRRAAPWPTIFVTILICRSVFTDLSAWNSLKNFNFLSEGELTRSTHVVSEPRVPKPGIMDNEEIHPKDQL
jgi:hypothetical protein